MIIKKVSIIVLLELLEELYSRGVDYIDVHGKPLTPDQDVLGVSFSRNYMDPDCIDNFDSFEGEEEPTEENTSPREVKKITLKEEDLNDLI